MGPSTDDAALLAEMMRSGMDLARFNFSHGCHEDHARRVELVRKAAAEVEKPIALIADTKGPEMRLGIFKEGRVILKEGDSFTLTTEEIEGTQEISYVNYAGLPEELQPGNAILLSDGLLALEVTDVDVQGGKIYTKVVHGGEISSRKRVACPGVELKLPFLSEQDISDITFAAKLGMDYVAASFVQKADDVLAIRRVLEEVGSSMGIISKIENPVKRAFYEMETMRGCWSARELERQIASLYYERCGLSNNKEALSALVQQQATLLQPKDIINTPVTLEFLGLNDRALVTENDLEQSILDNLQHFLLEMGHGFCFEARQKRILIDEDYFFADLVFYHRILKCHVIVELKIDKFRHEYASQLNMYLNYFKAEVMQPDDNPPIGILLCTEKGDTLVKYATAGLDPNIFVQKYMIELPTEEEIQEFISCQNY